MIGLNFLWRYGAPDESAEVCGFRTLADRASEDLRDFMRFASTTHDRIRSVGEMLGRSVIKRSDEQQLITETGTDEFPMGCNENRKLKSINSKGKFKVS